MSIIPTLGFKTLFLISGVIWVGLAVLMFALDRTDNIILVILVISNSLLSFFFFFFLIFIELLPPKKNKDDITQNKELKEEPK